MSYTVYGYVREPHHENGPTVEEQRDAILDFVNQTSSDDTINVDEIFTDDSSYWDVPWFERPAGSRLIGRLQPGDHISIATLGSIFRSIVDLCKTIDKLTNRTVSLSAIDCGLDTSLTIQRNFMAELNALAIDGPKEQIAEALQLKRMRGRPVNQNAPIGYQIRGRGADARYLPDPQERTVCYDIVRLHDEDDLSFRKIYSKFLRQRIKTKHGREWIPSRIWCAYHAAKECFPLPNGDRLPCFPWEREDPETGDAE